MNVQTNKRGFTIIEVVLVLAIAALIFLMIFVALPALQRGQANNARKSDVGTVASAIVTYRTNTNGEVPADVEDLADYVDNLSQLSMDDAELQDGAGVSFGDDDARRGALDTLIIVTNARCADDLQSTVAGSRRQAAVLTPIETSANATAVFCQNA